MPDTPLNPDGVLNAMDTLMAETDADERATEWARKVTTRVLEGYFAAALPDAIRELTEAIRLTVEYVGTRTLPAIPGWSWYDAMVKYAPEDAEVLRAMEPLPEASAALPEVTSVEELEALPEGTILRDSYGLALHKRTANWWVTNCDSNLTSEDLADEIADTSHTYTVLYRPEVKP